MVKIELDKKWVLTSDKQNWILAKRRVTKSGEEYTDHTYFFTSLQGALKHYAGMNLRESDASSVKKLLEAANSIDKRIREVLKPLGDIEIEK